MTKQQAIKEIETDGMMLYTKQDVINIINEIDEKETTNNNN